MTENTEKVIADTTAQGTPQSGSESERRWYLEMLRYYGQNLSLGRIENPDDLLANWNTAAPENLRNDKVARAAFKDALETHKRAKSRVSFG